MKKFSIILTCALYFASCSTDRVLQKANTCHLNMEYHSASELYKTYLEKKKDNTAQIRLAECLYHMNHFSEAEKQYAGVMKFPEVTAGNKLQYAHALKHNGKYEAAAEWFRNYLSDVPGDNAVKNELLSCDSINAYTAKSYEYIVKQVEFNSSVSDFSPVFYSKGIAFCSERSVPQSKSEISKWTGHTYLDLYYKPDTTKDAIKMEGLNSMYNDGPACFSADGRTVFFTRNLIADEKKHKLEKSSGSVNNFEIYTSVKDSAGSWTAPRLVSFDNKEYSVGHPALSADGSRMYFVSDMPGGLGGTDIYFSEYSAATATWGKPVNAGENINTSENEMFPTTYVDKEGNEFLYFSSEGRPGMGGLDIYSSLVLQRNAFVSADSSSAVNNPTGTVSLFSPATHLNAPLNSAADDFGMIFNENGLTGYFSSNRNSEEVDRIFHFEKYIPEFYLEVEVRAMNSLQVVSNAQLILNDMSHDKVDTLYTNENGRIFRRVEQNSMFDINAAHANYFSASGNIGNLGKIFTDTMRLVIELDSIMLNKPIVMNNVYYDFKKWDIREDAKTELDKLVKLLRENPDIVIELGSHTDSRGSDKLNQKLSQKRAESATNYLISQGICAKRIYARGYGESKLLNSCNNTVKCGEDEHQLNRRTEFKVLRIGKPEERECRN